MEKKGLIERRSVDYDARLRKIVLTDKARAIAEALRDNASRMEQVLLGGMSNAEVSQLLDLLDHMKRNLAATGMVGWECARPGEPGDAQETAGRRTGAAATASTSSTQEGTETI